MGWDHLNPYEYHPERGLYYHEVFPNLLCGSQPQTPVDIEQLHSQERVTNIVNLQACRPSPAPSSPLFHTVLLSLQPTRLARSPLPWKVRAELGLSMRTRSGGA
jgi:hypothetical protein